MRDKIAAFWSEFEKSKFALSRIESADDPVYDQMLASLQRIDPDLFFEMCASPDGNEFIVTAEGEERLFPLVEEIVRDAPEISDWELFALKPKRGFPVTTRWEQTQVVVGDVFVVPVFAEGGEMGLRLYAPNLTSANEEDIHNALLRALDVALGEREFAERIEATWVYPIEETPESAFPLTELDAYLSSESHE